jgi:hypothetical protein
MLALLYQMLDALSETEVQQNVRASSKRFANALSDASDQLIMI